MEAENTRGTRGRAPHKESAADKRRDGKIVAQDPLALDARAAAALLHVSRSHFFRLDSSGRLPRGFRLGRCRRWSRSELEAWLAAGAPSRERWEQACTPARVDEVRPC